MKKLLLITFSFLFISNMLVAQEKNFNNIVHFNLRNSGTITDTNNNVDGYYIFYQVDKLKKGNVEYAIKILDNELNLVATKSLIGKKYAYLVASAYNNKEILFMFINYKDKQYRLVGFDRKGNKSRDTKVAISKKELKWLLLLRDVGYDDILLPVDNKGFLLTTAIKNKKMGYKIEFLPSVDNLKSWTIESPLEAKKIFTIKPIKVDEHYIIGLEATKKSKLSKRMDMNVIAIDVATGKKLFTKPFTTGNTPKLVTNAFIDNDNIVLLGEYFKKDDNVLSSKSLGLFINSLDKSGKLINEKKIDHKNQLLAKLNSKGKKHSKRVYTYFHEIVKTKNGDYFAIGELYKKTASALGIAGAALSIASGGRNSSTVPLTQLTITDAVIYKFDKDFNLKDLKVIPKGKSTAPSVSDFGSPQLNAHALKALGAFDFMNLQTDPDKDRFYANFLDYNRTDKDKKGQLSYISAVIDNGALSIDRIGIKTKRRHSIKVTPAKLGHVLIMDYNRKEKSINLHLEKINVVK